MDASNPPVEIPFRRRMVGAMLACGAGLVWTVPAGAATGPLVMAFNTYAQSPFVEEEGGLAADLVVYLNQKLEGIYRFQLETIPRSRLMRLHLADPAVFNGIVLFLHPRFVDDAEQQRFLWTDGLFVDANVLVFRGPIAPPVHQLADLSGMRFGGTRDARYMGIDELVGSQAITRIDSSTLHETLKQIIAGRVDFTQTNATAFHALAQQPAWAGQFVDVPVPGDPEYTRHILVGKRNADLAERLNGIARGMHADPLWKTIVKRYGLKVPRSRTADLHAPAKPWAVSLR